MQNIKHQSAPQFCLFQDFLVVVALIAYTRGMGKESQGHLTIPNVVFVSKRNNLKAKSCQSKDFVWLINYGRV